MKRLLILGFVGTLLQACCCGGGYDFYQNQQGNACWSAPPSYPVSSSVCRPRCCPKPHYWGNGYDDPSNYDLD